MKMTCGAVAPRQRSVATVSRFWAMYAPIALATPMPPSSSAKVPTRERKLPSRRSARSRSACCSRAVLIPTRSPRSAARRSASSALRASAGMRAYAS